MNRRIIKRTVISMLCILSVSVPALSGACLTNAEELMAAVTFDVLVDGNEVYEAAPAPFPERRDGQKTPSEEGSAAVQEQPGEPAQDETAPGDGNGVQEPEGSQPEAGTGQEQVRVTLGAYTNGYDNRMYVSLRDLARLLNGTSAQFDIRMDFDLDSYEITKGAAYTFQEPEMVQAEPETLEGDYYDRDWNLRNRNDQIAYEAQDLTVPAKRPDFEYLELYMNPINVNGNEVRFYTYQLSVMRDIYMNITDAQFLLGITIEKDGDGKLNINTGKGFDIDILKYEKDGYFDLFNGVIVGDATTGEILYGLKDSNPDAIASTSKLMTYMVVARFLELGTIKMDDKVTLSQNVENLSYSGNGTLLMDAGWELTVHDLIAAMLIASSNESALALAEYVAGSEEEFVALMNEMAHVLGLTSARFYNSNGLVEYSDSLIASKRQNRMNVRDLFRLSCAVLRKYPEVTEFTSARTMYLPSLDYTAWNTSYLLYNMENAVGLKTGTTDEAGCCLVGASKVQAQDGEHILVAVIIGAENNIDRYQVPEILLTWAAKQILSR